jgi:hypothetical protein
MRMDGRREPPEAVLDHAARLVGEPFRFEDLVGIGATFIGRLWSIWGDGLPG